MTWWGRFREKKDFFFPHSHLVRQYLCCWQCLFFRIEIESKCNAIRSDQSFYWNQSVVSLAERVTVKYIFFFLPTKKLFSSFSLCKSWFSSQFNLVRFILLISFFLFFFSWYASCIKSINITHCISHPFRIEWMLSKFKKRKLPRFSSACHFFFFRWMWNLYLNIVHSTWLRAQAHWITWG